MHGKSQELHSEQISDSVKQCKNQNFSRNCKKHTKSETFLNYALNIISFFFTMQKELYSFSKKLFHYTEFPCVFFIWVWAVKLGQLKEYCTDEVAQSKI